ncbi:hydrogenase nickel incorporation protein HypA [Candidatus Bathyarchaeota archaeon]|nr:hydrogenase nickel incorporation protein HypA [Candidatus Bathyarchaeota archaeon]
MHEWALAEAVVAAARQIAKKEGLKEVKEVVIKVGELQQVELEIFKFALSKLEAQGFEGTEFNISLAKTELQCRVCEHKWLFDKTNLAEDTVEAIHFVPEVIHSYVRCAKCGSPDFKLLKGRGVWIERLRGAK